MFVSAVHITTNNTTSRAQVLSQRGVIIDAVQVGPSHMQRHRRTRPATYPLPPTKTEEPLINCIAAILKYLWSNLFLFTNLIVAIICLFGPS